MTTAQPFPYSEKPQNANGKPVPPPPPSHLLRMKEPNLPSGQEPNPRPDSDPSAKEPAPKQAKSRKAQTLRNRLLLTLLPTTLVPLAIISAVDYQISQNKIQEEEETILGEESFITSELSALFIEELQTNAEVIGLNPLLQQALRSADQEVAQKQ